MKFVLGVLTMVGASLAHAANPYCVVTEYKSDKNGKRVVVSKERIELKKELHPATNIYGIAAGDYRFKGANGGVVFTMDENLGHIAAEVVSNIAKSPTVALSLIKCDGQGMFINLEAVDPKATEGNTFDFACYPSGKPEETRAPNSNAKPKAH